MYIMGDMNFDLLKYHSHQQTERYLDMISLRSRRLDVVGTRNTGAREEDTLTPRVSPLCAPVLSFAHYFQAPAMQAMI